MPPIDELRDRCPGPRCPLRAAGKVRPTQAGRAGVSQGGGGGGELIQQRYQLLHQNRGRERKEASVPAPAPSATPRRPKYNVRSRANECLALLGVHSTNHHHSSRNAQLAARPEAWPEAWPEA